MKIGLTALAVVAFSFTSLQAVELTDDHKKMLDIMKSVKPQQSPAEEAEFMKNMEFIRKFSKDCTERATLLKDAKTCKGLQAEVLKLSLKMLKKKLHDFPAQISRIEKAIQDLEKLQLSDGQ